LQWKRKSAIFGAFYFHCAVNFYQTSCTFKATALLKTQQARHPRHFTMSNQVKNSKEQGANHRQFKQLNSNQHGFPLYWLTAKCSAKESASHPFCSILAHCFA
jgi:hypothetical protein